MKADLIRLKHHKVFQYITNQRIVILLLSFLQKTVAQISFYIISILFSYIFEYLFSFFFSLSHNKGQFVYIIIIIFQMDQSKKEQELIKLIIIGDCGVGKTNILFRFCENTFKNSYVATIGVDFKIKTINAKGTRIKLQIWDTAGQERFRNIAQTYYKGAAGIILTYSITQSKTFDNIERWIAQINEHAPKNVIKMLVANKLDLETQRVVQEREGRALASKYDMPFLEVSAKNGDSVPEMFNIMAELLVDNYLPNRIIDKQRYSINSHKFSQSQENSRRKCEC